MPAGLSAWALFAGFVLSLISFVAWGLRLIARGKLIQGVIYDDVRGQRDSWRKAAETALATNSKHSDNEQRLVAAVEQLTATQRETLALVRLLVPQRIGSGDTS